jgi:hypothetical protein
MAVDLQQEAVVHKNTYRQSKFTVRKYNDGKNPDTCGQTSMPLL